MNCVDCGQRIGVVNTTRRCPLCSPRYLADLELSWRGGWERVGLIMRPVGDRPVDATVDNGATGGRPTQFPNCGTVQGYWRHAQLKEKCGECLEARRLHERARRAS